MGVIKRIELSDGERTELERVVNAASSEVRMVERARIVLCATFGLAARRRYRAPVSSAVEDLTGWQPPRSVRAVLEARRAELPVGS